MYTAACIVTNSLPHVLQGDWNVLHALRRKYGAELPLLLVRRCTGRVPRKERRGEENTLNAVLLVTQSL